MAVSGHLLDERGELTYLGLAYGAGVKWVVEYDDEQLDEAPGTVERGEQRGSGIFGSVAWKGPALMG